MKQIVISISSDFGVALARKWLLRGDEVIGTYRRWSSDLEDLKSAGCTLVYCDLASASSVDAAIAELTDLGSDWDNLLIASGLQDPVGLFADCDFQQWTSSIDVNFTAPMKIVQSLLPLKNTNNLLLPMVLFFAGGGTNGATLNYSAYTIAKISLVKMCELMDAEIPSIRVSIIGPGWVKTKIHQSTIDAGERAGGNYQRTLEKLASEECVPMSAVVDCVEWALTRPRDVIGGRNVSLVYDDWGNPNLDDALKADKNLYKLRRFGNDTNQRSVIIQESNMKD